MSRPRPSWSGWNSFWKWIRHNLREADKPRGSLSVKGWLFGFLLGGVLVAVLVAVLLLVHLIGTGLGADWS